MPIYILHMPNVKALCFTSANPAVFIIGMNLSGLGKFSTDAGRYLYALLFPDTAPPMAGRM
jgi:hypothetical protein